MKILVLAPSVLALAGCYETLGHHYDHHLDDHHAAEAHAYADHLASEQAARDYRVVSLPPTSPDGVSIMLAAPACPFLELAMLQATAIDMPGPQLQQLKYQAAMMGADAILLLHDDPYGHQITAQDGSPHGYSARAIVFTAPCRAP
jgi:hypothetical protein